MSADFTFLKGNIETIILCALYNKDMYGYELAKSIKERSGNKYEIKQPTLYSYLKRLEQDGYVFAYWGGESSGGRRRYYKLTEQGRADCEKFLAEWEYQRSVMGSLVDGTVDVSDSALQGDQSLLLGRKPSRRRKRASTIDEQDEFARRLSEIDGLSNPTDQQADDDVATTVITDEQPPVLAEEPTAPIVEPTVTTTTPVQTAVFDVQQDDADVFIEDFNRLAQQVSQTPPASAESPAGQNYQHTLLNIIGDQLDEAQQRPDATSQIVTTIDGTAELEEVADTLAREGIRLRIYNHATANFKSKTLMPFPKVLCQTGWITYLCAVVIFGLLAVTSISSQNWLAPIITLSVLVVFPIGLTVYALANQIRIEKPQFNFKVFLVATIILTAIVALVSLAISIFNNIELSNYAEVVNKILLPTAVGLMPTLAIVVYNQLYKKY